MNDPASDADTAALADYWDRRYGETPMWSGRPNANLVAEVQALTPGRALDVAAGEGGDAIWLAEQGWQVTANDISRRALERLVVAAAARGVHVEVLHGDANAPDVFPRDTFDLVSACYASIPRTPDRRAVRAMVDAVAPGGTLVVLGHDLSAARDPHDDAGVVDHDRCGHDPHGGAVDHAALVQVDDFAAILEASAGWVIEVLQRRARPPGAASSHHVDDIVLRARRGPAGEAAGRVPAG